MRRLPGSVVVTACALLCGCSYVKNRTNDLLDVFRFDVGFGPGLYAEARVTDFAAVGLGFRDQELASMFGRFVGNPEVSSVALGPFVLGGRVSLDMKPLLPGDTSGFRYGQDVPGTQILFIPGDAPRCNGYSFAERGLRMADVGADVALGYVGLGLGVSPGEFVDLLLGFVGIDIGGDDMFGRAPTTREHTKADEGADPR
jgi:hypothetical protein